MSTETQPFIASSKKLLLAHTIRGVLLTGCLGCVGGTAAAADAGSLEEVIVTARKANERLQDVPMAVTAITGKQIEELGAVEIKDMLVPGLSFSNVDRGQAKYNIRGIANGVTVPTVGVYLDDISLVTNSSGFTGAFDAVFFDIERVEILKGPQGTLYGGSAMGGAIKYVSALPDMGELSSSVAASLSTTHGGGESYNAEGVVNLPVIDDVLALRIGGLYRHEAGYIDNVPNAELEDTAYSSTPFPVYTPMTRPTLSTRGEDDYNSSNTYVGRLSLLWQPSETLSVRPTLFVQDYELDNPSWFFTNLEEFTASYRLPQRTKDRSAVYSLDINKEFSGVELTSLTAYFDRTLTWNRDYSYFVAGLVPPLFDFNTIAHYPYDTKTFSQEVRLASKQGSEAPVTWLAGLYYRDQDETFNPEVLTENGQNSLLGTDRGLDSDRDSGLTEYAAFGEATYHLTDALDVSAGVRLFRIDQDYHAVENGPFAGGFSTLDRSSREDGVNPKVGVSYEVTDRNLLYASASKGFRAGGFVLTPVFPGTCNEDLARLGFSSTPTKYDPDELWTYEIGSKNELGSGRGIVNAAVFYSDWKDIQQLVLLPNCGHGFPTNAGDARVTGAEMELLFNVTPGLQIGGNATYTDAEIVSVPFASIAREGDEIQDVPEWMASAFGSYSIPLGGEVDLLIRADYQYRDGQRQQFDATQAVLYSDGTRGLVPYGATFQDGYEVVNAYASLSMGLTNIRLYINNALDERPQLDKILSFGSSRATTIRPRTIGIELRQQF